MSLKRQPTRKQPPLTTRYLHRRTQQRMIRHTKPRTTHITHTHPRRKPKPLTLKRIPRQIHPPRATTSKQHTPIHPHTTHPRLRQRMHEPLPATLIAPQRTHHPNTPPLPTQTPPTSPPPQPTTPDADSPPQTPTRLTRKRPHPQSSNRTRSRKFRYQYSPSKPRRIQQTHPSPRIRTAHHPTPAQSRTTPQQLLTKLLHLHRMRRIINRHLAAPAHPHPHTHRKKLLQRPTTHPTPPPTDRTIHRRDTQHAHPNPQPTPPHPPHPAPPTPSHPAQPNPPNARLRNTTTRAASPNDNPPATHAAAISPCE